MENQVVTSLKVSGTFLVLDVPFAPACIAPRSDYG